MMVFKKFRFFVFETTTHWYIILHIFVIIYLSFFGTLWLYQIYAKGSLLIISIAFISYEWGWGGFQDKIR